jgi:hypothetical protein
MHTSLIYKANGENSIMEAPTEPLIHDFCFYKHGAPLEPATDIWFLTPQESRFYRNTSQNESAPYVPPSLYA